MKVPLLDLKEQNVALAKEFRDALDRLVASGQFILGAEVESFERALADHTGSGHAVGVSSGTDALLVALMAEGVGPGDEVVCPSFTFFATAGCVARLGAKPVFVDACPICYNMAPEGIAPLVNQNTKAIVTAPLFGQAADIDPILEIADGHGVPVIEDAAQSLGARYRGKAVGTSGKMGAFSFFPSKNLGALGDGGAIVTDDGALAEKLRILRNHGMAPKYYHARVGGNFRIDALQAAFLGIKLAHLGEYEAGRRRNAEFYRRALLDLPGVSEPVAAEGCCGSIDKTNTTSEDARIVLPAVHGEVREAIWNQFTLRVIGDGARDELRRHLLEAEVGSEIYYPVPLHRQPCFAGINAPALPVCERLAGEVLSLPVFPELSESQLGHVVASIATWLRR